MSMNNKTGFINTLLIWLKHMNQLRQKKMQAVIIVTSKRQLIFTFRAYCNSCQ